jgi:hypothetical protein
MTVQRHWSVELSLKSSLMDDAGRTVMVTGAESE